MKHAPSHRGDKEEWRLNRIYNTYTEMFSSDFPLKTYPNNFFLFFYAFPVTQGETFSTWVNCTNVVHKNLSDLKSVTSF